MNRVVYISGLPGVGKSTVGKALSESLGWEFHDSDWSVTDDMRAKLKSGELLSDQELDTVVLQTDIPEIVARAKQGPTIAVGLLAKESYRTTLRDAVSEIDFINLAAPYAVLKERVEARGNFVSLEIFEQCYAMRDLFSLPGPSVETDRPLSEVIEDCLRLIKTPQDI